MKTILLVLPGSTAAAAVDYYQVLQEETALAEAASLGLSLEVVKAPGFDHLRVIRKRLGDTGAPALDAVVVEPGSLSSTELILKELKGRCGLVLLNAWSPAMEELARLGSRAADRHPEHGPRRDRPHPGGPAQYAAVAGGRLRPLRDRPAVPAPRSSASRR